METQNSLSIATHGFVTGNSLNIAVQGFLAGVEITIVPPDEVEQIIASGGGIIDLQPELKFNKKVYRIKLTVRVDDMTITDERLITQRDEPKVSAIDVSVNEGKINVYVNKIKI